MYAESTGFIENEVIQLGGRGKLSKNNWNEKSVIKSIGYFPDGSIAFDTTFKIERSVTRVGMKMTHWFDAPEHYKAVCALNWIYCGEQIKDKDLDSMARSYCLSYDTYKLNGMDEKMKELGDFFFNKDKDEHSGWVQAMYGRYLKTSKDPLRQSRYDQAKVLNDQKYSELLEDMLDLVEDMNEQISNSISSSNQKPAQRNNSSTGSSSSCRTTIYICNDCSKMQTTSGGSPNDRTTCPEPRWKGVSTPFKDGKHAYAKIGTCGSNKYHCNGCGNSISISSFTSKGTCGARGNNNSNHQWIKN